MKRLLYIGNKLATQGTVTYIEKLGKLLEEEGYHLQYASSQPNKIRRMLEMIWATIAQRQKTDYVLIDTYSTTNFWYAFAISQLCRCLHLRYIPILHGGNLPNRLNQNPLLSKWIFKYAFANVAPSGYLLAAFKNAGFGNTVFIPNALSIAEYPFKQRESFGPKLLWVRSFSPLYNPHMALEVLENLRKLYPQAELCMVGPDKGNLESVRQLALQKQLKVTFTGKLTPREWTALSSDYDIFLNTTHVDNTPLSVMEAMALGLPIVSTNVGGIPFLLTHNKTALLVSDNAATQMTDAIVELLENPAQATALVWNAKKQVTAFDWENVREKWFGILK